MDAQGQAFPETIGPYRIEREVGTGGMGTVYRAYHQGLARPVALKRIRPDGGNRDQLRERFTREARAAARLSHPNIVHVYDILEHDGEDWIVMELAEGMTLDQLAKGGPLPLKRGLSIARDVVRGLAAAHARKIVHRDLKVENVIVGASGHAKILDFGLAKLQDLHDDSDVSSDGRLLGTARAMSPEQIHGEPVDHRSDLFSLGTLLYEIFSGTSPFQGPVMMQTLMRIYNHTQPPLRSHNPDVPQALSDLVDQLLQKDPSHRPQSAEDVLLALEKLRRKGPELVRMLFVDDEPDFESLIRLRYRKALRAKKIELVFARDGLEALEKLKSDEGIQLVMADINMPRMDGLTLLGEIGNLDRIVLTVMVSAYGDMGNIRRAMNLGAFDFVTKPIDFQDLDRTRQKALGMLARMNQHEDLLRENVLLEERNRIIRASMGHSLRRGGAWAEEGVPLELTVVSIGLRGLGRQWEESSAGMAGQEPGGRRQIENPGKGSTRIGSAGLGLAGLGSAGTGSPEVDSAGAPDPSGGDSPRDQLSVGEEPSGRRGRLLKGVVDGLFRHGGLVVGWRRDPKDVSIFSITVAFGLPVPHPEDSTKAVAFLEDLRQLLERVGPEIEMRAGADVGEASLLSSDSSTSRSHRLIGPAAERAQLLEKRCDFGEILLSTEVSARARLVDAGTVQRVPGGESESTGEIEALRLGATLS